MSSSRALQKLQQIQQEHSLEEDDEANWVIGERLKEVKSMVKRRAELLQVWENMDTKQRERILRAQNTPTDQLKKERRKKWKSIDVFRNAAHMCYMLVKAFVNRRTYSYMDKVPTAPAAMRRQKKFIEEANQSEPVTRSSLAFETQLAMSIAPTLRNEENIRQILWVLRATKAFYHFFPAEMEMELAKVVAYEKYDDARVIAKQGRPPDRFYYIMTGKVHLIREYVLNAGTVQKSMGYLTKGMTTDPNELDHAWYRDVNFVANGQVEVLLIEKSDFARLQYTTAGPPLEFLRNLELFREFPCERFLDSADALGVQYYSQNRVIVADSNRTPWLHVVKSGCVKVIREQNVIDTRNDKLFSGRTVEDLGCVRQFSHAEAMLGILAQQRKMKTLAQLPDIQNTTKVSNDVEESNVEQSDSSLVTQAEIGTAPILNSKRLKCKDTPNLSPLLNSSYFTKRCKIAGSTCLSQERTDETNCERKDKGETVQRKAYLQLDLLKTGDVFGLSAMASKVRKRDDEGLEHMESALASQAPGVILISDGAEVIRINKRFFLQHARNNTMLKIETMQREYMSEGEAMEQLYKTETWHRYKTALMSRTIQGLART